jgi:hypothetical protein
MRTQKNRTTLKSFSSCLSLRRYLDMQGSDQEALPWLLQREGRFKGDEAAGEVEASQQGSGVQGRVLLLVAGFSGLGGHIQPATTMLLVKNTKCKIEDNSREFFHITTTKERKVIIFFTKETFAK